MKEKEETYRVIVVCRNCGWGGGNPEVFLTIPKGTLVSTHIVITECKNCGCVGHFKKVKESKLAKDGD